jgi:hypothetical protein
MHDFVAVYATFCNALALYRDGQNNANARHYRNKTLDFKLSPCSECLCFLLGNSPASEFYMPTFRNTSVPSS